MFSSYVWNKHYNINETTTYMNLRIILFTVSLLFVMFQLKGQSIVFIRTDLQSEYNTKEGKASEIKYSNKFYGEKGTIKEKKRVLLTEKLDTIREQNLKGSKPIAEYIWIFEKPKQPTKKIFRQKKGDNWTEETTSFKYSQSGLVQIKTEDETGKRLSQTMIINDHKKNPIKITHYNKEGVLSGFETAVYNYNFGTWVNDIYDKAGNLKEQKKFRFEPKPHKLSKFNEKGDIILEPINAEEGTFFLTEYKYDFLGNWVKKKTFKVKKIEGKFKNKKKHEYLKRKIKYYGVK